MWIRIRHYIKATWPLECLISLSPRLFAHTLNQVSNKDTVQVRDHSVFAPGQWEAMLQCNTISHWLSAYTECSLQVLPWWFFVWENHWRIPCITSWAKQRFLTPGHQGWNDLHSLCRIGMEYYLLNNDDNNIIYWIMMIIMIMMMIMIMIIMMTMMIIGTATIMIMIIIITTTLTMTIMKMIMIKTAQTPCQSLYKDRRI